MSLKAKCLEQIRPLLTKGSFNTLCFPVSHPSPLQTEWLAVIGVPCELGSASLDWWHEYVT
jgi:hypothetical protein